ncbi:MAG: LysM peptidoglycan-binding domain-containing protein [Clostridia bacterium]|nr:LysM peptidoglycan-binding domain-containing protein [Clostridia bacterium]
MKNQLTLKIPRYYKVKEGQTVCEIAAAFSLPPSLLIKENGLTGEVAAGEIVKLPIPCGNLYTVQAGDSKTLLSGSAEKYRQKNRTDILYPGMKIFL